MKRRFAIINNNATEIIHVSKDELDIMSAMHPGAVGIPTFFNEGRFFPSPLREVIITQDYYGF